jgi:integrase
MGSITTDKAFSFTEARVEEAMRLVAAGQAQADGEGRRLWRDSGSPHGLYLRASASGGAYYRIHKVRGRKVKTRIGDALAMRVTKAREAALKLAGGDATAAAKPVRVRTDGITISQAWKAYIADVESGDFVAGRKPTAASTIASYKILFDAHVGRPYGAKSLHYLARIVPELHRKLRAKPVTANRLVQVIRNLFTHAARTGNWDKPNPTLDPVTGRGIKKYTVASRSRHLTTAEAARVLAFAATEPQPWKDFWRLLILTGVRASTLREMKWAHLDLRAAESSWAVPTTKNGDPQLVPLTDTAAAILRERLDDAPKHQGKSKQRGKPISEWVFPMRDDPKVCIADLDHAWARVKEGAPLDGVRIHDLRRTAGSWATQGGAPLPAVGKLLGHRSHNSTAVYARADTKAARAAAEIVEARLLEAGDKK